MHLVRVCKHARPENVPAPHALAATKKRHVGHMHRLGRHAHHTDGAVVVQQLQQLGDVVHG